MAMNGAVSNISIFDVIFSKFSLSWFVMKFHRDLTRRHNVKIISEMSDISYSSNWILFEKTPFLLKNHNFL